MRIVPVFMAAVILLSGCGGSSGSGGRRTIVAAFYPLAFVAQQLGGKKVDVKNLTPPGADGKKIDALAGIDLRRGVGDEAGKSDPHVWLDPALFSRLARRIGGELG